MSAASREPFLCAAQITRQDRYDDDCQEAHGSPPRSQHGRELQAPGHDRANLTAEIASAISYQLSGKNLVRKAAFGRPSEARQHLRREPMPNFIKLTSESNLPRENEAR